MKFIVLSVGDKPKVMEQERIELADLQHYVEGYVECPFVPELDAGGVTLWANEEGLCVGMAPNLSIKPPEFFEAMVIVGPVVFTSHNGEGETTGLSEKQEKMVKEWIERNRYDPRKVAR